MATRRCPEAYWEAGPGTAAWRRQVSAAQSWVLDAQERGAVYAEDQSGQAWRIFRSRNTGNLYYVRGQCRLAELSGLRLRGSGPLVTAKHMTSRYEPIGASSPSLDRSRLRLGEELRYGAYAKVLSASLDGVKGYAVKRSLGGESDESVQRDEHFLRLVKGHRGVAGAIGGFWDASARRCLVLPQACTDLAHYAQEGDARFLNAAEQLAAALRHVHEHGVVHMDVKPRNVLVFCSATAPLLQLADFGSALRRGQELDPEKMYECTRPYRPPELLVASRQAAMPYMDLWAFGVLLWEIHPSSGNTHPLKGAQNSVEQIVLVVALVGCSPAACEAWGFVEMQPAAPFHAEIPAALQSWVGHLLQPEPSKRALPELRASRSGREPSKVDDAHESAHEVDSVEQAGNAAVIAGCGERSVVDDALEEQIESHQS